MYTPITRRSPSKEGRFRRWSSRRRSTAAKTIRTRSTAMVNDSAVSFRPASLGFGNTGSLTISPWKSGHSMVMSGVDDKGSLWARLSGGSPDRMRLDPLVAKRSAAICPHLTRSPANRLKTIPEPRSIPRIPRNLVLLLYRANTWTTCLNHPQENHPQANPPCGPNHPRARYATIRLPFLRSTPSNFASTET